METHAQQDAGPKRHLRSRSRGLLRQIPAWRMVILLLVNLSVYCGACAFWYYLSSGEFFNFAISAYRGDFARPLSRMLEYPLDVFAYPWMILVIGVFLAAMIFVPIIIVVLYRLSFAIMFVIVIAVLGHTPVLALAVLIGCLLAYRNPLRHSVPFAAAMLGMLPAGLYLLVSALGFAEVAGVGRLVQHGPFILAALAAIVATSAVLALARLSRYRPGVIWPVITALIIGPAVIFFVNVSPDELAYSLIANQVARPDSIFMPVTLGTWTDKPSRAGLSDVTLRTAVTDDLDSRRTKLTQQCRFFLQRYQRSRRSSSVLWIQAQCASLQLHDRAFTAEKPVVSYTADFPLPESSGLWRRLGSEYGSSPHAGLAAWRLAELALRRQQPDQARQLLSIALKRLARFETSASSKTKTSRGGSLLRTPSKLPSADYYANALFEVNKLLWLIDQNDLLDDPASAGAMARLMSINPNDSGYGERIGEILSQSAPDYEHTKMGDNLLLAAAKANPDIYEKRAGMLMSLAEGTSDAAIQANYELALLLIQQPVLRLKPGIEDSRTYFKRVKEARPNPWTHLASEQLELQANAPQGPGSK